MVRSFWQGFGLAKEEPELGGGVYWSAGSQGLAPLGTDGEMELPWQEGVVGHHVKLRSRYASASVSCQRRLMVFMSPSPGSWSPI